MCKENVETYSLQRQILHEGKFVVHTHRARESSGSCSSAGWGVESGCVRRVTSSACATMSSCWSAWARSMAITTSRDCRCSLSADVCASCWGFCGWMVQRRVVERYLEVGICWIKGQGPLRPIRARRNVGLWYMIRTSRSMQGSGEEGRMSRQNSLAQSLACLREERRVK